MTYYTASVEESTLFDRIQELNYLHPYILTAFGYSYERIAVELNLSVGQINRYNPLSRSKTRCKPPLSICRLTWFLVEKILIAGKNPKLPAIFDEYLLQAKKII